MLIVDKKAKGCENLSDNFESIKLDRRIYLDDIAKELGVSKSTVSRAMSGKGRISEATKLRVMECIKEHNYRPNVIAKSLASSKTFNIGVVLPADKDLSEIPFFQSCLLGVCEVTSALDYDVVVITAKSNDISQLERLIDNRKVDGVILTRSVLHDPAIEYLKRQNVPFVLIGSNDDNSIVQIDTDHTSACAEMTSYLLSSGSKKPALLIGSTNFVVNNARLAGFRRAHERAGLFVTENLIYRDMTNHAIVERAVIDLLGKGADCIVCGDDYICSRVLTELEVRGISIPKSIKVASFYNSAFLKSHTPAITAVDIDVTELGIQAGKTIIDIVSRRKVSDKNFVGYELSIKKSTL